MPGEGALPVDGVLEGAAVDELHGHEPHAAFLTDEVDLDDVGVDEVGLALGLALEAGEEGGIAGELGAEGLEGDGAVQRGVEAEVDGAHAARRDLSLDAEVMEVGAGGELGGDEDVGERHGRECRGRHGLAHFGSGSTMSPRVEPMIARSSWVSRSGTAWVLRAATRSSPMASNSAARTCMGAWSGFMARPA